MANKIIDVEIKKEAVIGLLSDIKEKTGNLQPAMWLVSEIMKRSIVQNFLSEGRPKWDPRSQRAIKKGGITLSDTGHLRDSMQNDATPLIAEVSTIQKYAAIHNFGGTVNKPARTSTSFFKQFKSGKRKGRILFSKEKSSTSKKDLSFKAFSFEMPKREFMMVQEEDWEPIRQKIAAYLLGL